MSVQGLTVSILVNGRDAETELRSITVAFERAGDEAANFSTGLFQKLPGIFEAEERRQFDGQGAGPSGGWAQLSADYAAWKEKKHPGNPILVLEDRMRQALTSSSSPFAQRVASGDEFEFGTHGLEYASYHQLGTTKMPARPVFDMSADFEQDLQEATLQQVRDAVRTSGLSEFVEGP